MKNIKHLIWLTIIILPITTSAWQWIDLWQTRNQQGAKLLQSGKAEAAAQIFKDKNWQSVSHYRSGNYAQAFKQFNNNQTSDGQYNAGNAAAFLGKYEEAIAAYDKAIALNSNNQDAITNREIIKKLLQKKQQQQKNESKQQKQDQQEQMKDQQQKQAQQQKQPQNQSSANNNKNDKSNSSSQQNNLKQSNQTDKQNQAQNAQKNSQEKSNQSQQNRQHSTQTKADDTQQNSKATSAENKQQRQDENKQQLLRSLPDDPGGLLQQKFLRDYVRRHGMDENRDQGVS